MQAFVINLERSVQRRESIKKQLDEQQIPFEFIKAVDGSTLSDEYLQQICDFKELATRPHLQFKGMYGCILSHYNIYKKMVEENIPMALILEDDAELQPMLKPALEAIERIIQPNEAILLFSQNNYMPTVFSTQDTVEITPKHKVCYPMTPWVFGSTAAYVITLEAARGMYNYVLPIRVGPDGWGHFYEDNAIHSLRCVTPFLAQPAGFKSDINYVATDSMRGKILKVINDYNIFPIKQLLDFRRKRVLARTMAYSFSTKPSPVVTHEPVGRPGS